MAYICRLIEGTEPAIDLQYNVGAGWSLLNRGIQIADPQVFELWGGQRSDQLVRRKYGKRVIPLRLSIEEADGVDLIDSVNALQERLHHAARHRIDGWGDEVFLELQIDDSTDTVRFPVCSGEIDKNELYSKCGGEPDDMIKNVPVTLNCEAPWEDDSTYVLENYVDNPGWWRWAALPGDSWAEVNAPDVTSTQDDTIWEVMGYSLKMEIAPDAGLDTGVVSDAIAVNANIAYYIEGRVYSRPANDTFTIQVYDLTNGAIIPASILTFPAAPTGWVKLGVTFTTPNVPLPCISVAVECYRLLGDSTAGNKIYYVDAIYLTPGASAPVGWSSGRNLTNELDAADQINVVCVTEIPGELQAESRIDMPIANTLSYLRLARRTRSVRGRTPGYFIWELLGVNAVVTAGDAACINSVAVGDGSAPGGTRVDVTFANPNMVLRTYWDIITDLTDYYGKFAIIVLAKKTGAVDDITMRLTSLEDPNFVVGQIVKDIPQGTTWPVIDGFDVFSFRIGTHDGDLFGPGNNWRIMLYAASDPGGTDTLRIAGAYLVSLDEAYLIGGGTTIWSGGTTTIIVKDLDGDRGLFAYDSATGTHYANYGAVGQHPLLEPTIENWLYFILSDANDEVDITDSCTVRVTYRPQGIFLRGTNP